MESASIKARLDRQYLVLHLPRDVDDDVKALRERLQAIDPNTDVVLDMSDVQQCTPVGLKMLSSVRDRFAEGGGSLTLSRPTPALRETLRQSDYAEHLKIRRKDR